MGSENDAAATFSSRGRTVGSDDHLLLCLLLRCTPPPIFFFSFSAHAVKMIEFDTGLPRIRGLVVAVRSSVSFSGFPQRMCVLRAWKTCAARGSSGAEF